MARPEIADKKHSHTAKIGELDAYSIEAFCAKHSISIAFYYKLRSMGLGPREFEAGTRKLISRESAGEWRREREAATAAKRREYATARAPP